MSLNTQKKALLTYMEYIEHLVEDASQRSTSAAIGPNGTKKLDLGHTATSLDTIRKPATPNLI